MKELAVVHLGLTEYEACWNLQRRLFAMRGADAVPDILLLTEHQHVYTIGKSGDDNHLLATPKELETRRVSLFHNDRGGDITYHGPGQLVGYPILDLNGYYLDLHRYLRDLEEVVIRTISHFGIRSRRVNGYTGVWVGDEKICAIGVKSSRWITMHGFAFNINTDLSYFSRIIPCGIFEKGVTSLEALTGDAIDLSKVSRLLVHEFVSVFGVTTREAGIQSLVDNLHDQLVYQ